MLVLVVQFLYIYRFLFLKSFFDGWFSELFVLPKFINLFYVSYFST